MSFPDWTSVSISTLAEPTFGGGVTYDTTRDRVVIYQGGYFVGGSNTFADITKVWEFYSGDWHSVTVAGHPPFGTEFGSTFTYDEGNNNCVWAGLVGGGVDNCGTWIYNGTTFTNAAPANQPHVGGACAAYDRTNSRVVRFGGNPSFGVLSDDTHLWNGTNWVLQAPGTKPSARVLAAMCWDDDRGEIVMFGGQNASNVPNDETWVWDGTDWTQKSPATSPPADIPWNGLAFDPVLGVCVLVTSADAPHVWTWDGTDWAGYVPTTYPPVPQLNGVVFNADAGKTMSVGSEDTSNTAQENWYLDSPGVPDAPVLSVSCDGDDVVLDWTTPSDAGSAITGYDIYRGVSSGTETLYDSVAVVNTFTDTAPGSTHFYEVLAVNANGDGTLSNELQRACGGPVYQRIYGWRTSIDDNALETVDVLVSPQGFTG